jgi:hypothetical protein
MRTSMSRPGGVIFRTRCGFLNIVRIDLDRARHLGQAGRARHLDGLERQRT